MQERNLFANLLRWPDRRLLELNIIASGVHARRVIDRQIAAEQALASAPSSKNHVLIA